MSQIKELFAWIVEDPSAEHGIVAVALGGLTMQAVSSKRHVVEKLRPFAENAARESGLPVKLQHFVLAETVDEIP